MEHIERGPNPKSRSHAITLFVCEHLMKEPIWEELVSQGHSFVPFSRVKKGWETPERPGVFLIHEDFLVQEFLSLFEIFSHPPDQRPIIIIGEKVTDEYLASLFVDRPFFYLAKPFSGLKLLETVRLAGEVAEKDAEINRIGRKYERAQQEIKDLHSIGMALSSEKDPDRLLEMILTKSRTIAEADAGSLYLIEKNDTLRFKLFQNSSLNWQVKEDFKISVNETSIAGQVALLGKAVNLLDVYCLPDPCPFTFNKSLDEKSGYRSKSMIAVPMKNLAGKVLGVIQLINKRSDFEHHRPGKPLNMEKVLPFSRKDLNLLNCLASQAAISLENSRLYQEIKNLFSGFVKASVSAIEARDPTTYGHSERVAALTVAFAKRLNDLAEGPFAGFTFDEQQLKELRYSALLHDFGKVGVREEVLVKAKKLYPHELEALKRRFILIRKSMKADFLQRCLDFVERNGPGKFDIFRSTLQEELRRQQEELDELVGFLVSCNEPGILDEEKFRRLLEIAQRSYTDLDGATSEFLNEREVHLLSIRKGSLSEAERMEMESHVTHSFNFLTRIPWTEDLKRVAEIAYAHHEKCNGRGYPNHLEESQIPLESQIMCVCDIFDALTAKDRPYKKALPVQKALEIMTAEADQGLISKSLLDLFIREKIYEVLEKKDLC